MKPSQGDTPEGIFEVDTENSSILFLSSSVVPEELVDFSQLSYLINDVDVLLTVKLCERKNTRNDYFL